jgi:hypothetical protein
MTENDGGKEGRLDCVHVQLQKVVEGGRQHSVPHDVAILHCVLPG